MIVGTLPPPRFTTGELKQEDVDFCYGSANGMLWPILDRIFELGLKYETTAEAILQREQFLLKHKIGICDIVQSAERTKIDASDLGMQNVELRDLVGYLKQYPNIDTILFTGGNSKNGPEYFFRKQLKEYGLSLEVISDVVPRIHEFELPVNFSEVKKASNMSVRAPACGTGRQSRTIKTVSLTAPSGAANRAIGSLQAYKEIKNRNPNFTTLDFRVMQYREFF